MALERVDSRMMIDSGGELECKLVPDNPRKELEREEKTVPPGPAGSKGGRVTRSRSNSASRVPSSAGGASNATTATRRNRRRAEFDANRHVAEESDPEQGGGSTVVVVSDDTEDEEFFSPSHSREPSLKRKMEDGEKVLEATRRKQGRPQTTGLYVGRAEAMDICIKKEKELAKLQEEKLLREMSSGQLFSKLERDLEEAIEELENAPTADIANQAREFMAQVVRVAKGSKNLQGNYIRLLKQAAVMGAATTEILRTRADRGESDSEISRLLKATRKELANVRREAASTREELDSIRKELAEEREKGKRMSRRRAVIDDSPPPIP